MNLSTPLITDQTNMIKQLSFQSNVNHRYTRIQLNNKKSRKITFFFNYPHFNYKVIQLQNKKLSRVIYYSSNKISKCLFAKKTDR